jgi:hypothetical protein
MSGHHGEGTLEGKEEVENAENKMQPPHFGGNIPKGKSPGREFPRNRPWGEMEGGAGFPKKEEGDSSFLGISGEWGFKKKEPEKGMHNLA